LLPPVTFGLVCFILRREGMLWRRAFLLAAILLGAFVAIDTEILSLFTSITRGSVATSWAIAVVAAIVMLVRRWKSRNPAPPVEFRIDIAILCAALAILLLGLAVAAYFSAPNIADGVSYHMPRVMHWIQNRSVRHYPTNITRQLHMPPMAEFV